MTTPSPPDIFLSYAHEDEPKARRLAEALATRGWSVFWDRRIPPGSTWYSHIGAALAGARCVIVGWSAASIASNWVLEEAGDGRDRGVLVPVLFEAVQPPLGFRSIQASDLSAWDAATEYDAYAQLVAVLVDKLGTPPNPAGSDAVPPPAAGEKAVGEQRRAEGQRPQPLAEKAGSKQDSRRRMAEPELPPRVGEEKRPPQEGFREVGEPGTEGGQKPRRPRVAPLVLVLAGFVGLVLAVVYLSQPPPPPPVVSSPEPAQLPLVAPRASQPEPAPVLSAPEPSPLPPRVERPTTKPEPAPVLSAPEPSPLPPRVERPTTKPEPGTIFRDTLRDGGEGPEMVVIPVDAFWMGSDKKRDPDATDHELPRHKVTLARPFAIGRYEVTFEDYDRFASATRRAMPKDREDWGRGRRPVINVSRDDASAYATWLSQQTGKRYRLPTEAEWEYAARGGTQTRYWWGDDPGKNKANCEGCGSQWDNKQTAPVGSFKPNPFGLHDMLGNVWEWVEDCWHDSYDGAPQDGSAWLEAGGGNCGQPVVRGGSWDDEPWFLRAAFRDGVKPDYRYYSCGFRLAQDL